MHSGLFRHVPAGGDPLFRPEHPADGRWQRGEVVEGFYLAADEQTAWAEWYRALAELAVPPMRQMPRDLWRYDVGVEGAADLSDVDRLAAVGLPSPDPARGQWPPFQAVGEALASEGWPGVLYPSASSAARSAEDLALCLFRRTTRIPGVDPVGPPATKSRPRRLGASEPETASKRPSGNRLRDRPSASLKRGNPGLA